MCKLLFTMRYSRDYGSRENITCVHNCDRVHVIRTPGIKELKFETYCSRYVFYEVLFDED